MTVAALAGLITWQSGLVAPSPEPNSIAIIPFKNLSGDPAQAYLSDGVSEEIRQELMRVPSIRIVAPGSVNVALANSSDANAVARTLAIGLFLNGGVRRSGNELHVSASLTESRTGTTIWAEKFVRNFDNIFDVQAEIASKVANIVSRQSLAPGAAAVDAMRIVSGGTKSVEAFEAYLKGDAFYRSFAGEGSLMAALAQIDAAIATDPKFARAHSKRAIILATLCNGYVAPTEHADYYRKALDSARKGVSLAPKLGTSQDALGFVLMNGFLEMKGAKIPYERANLFAPNDPSVESSFAIYAAQMGWSERARSAIDKALSLDPLNPIILNIDAFVRLCARDYEGTLRSARKTLEIQNHFPFTQFYAGTALIMQRKFDLALDHFKKEATELVRIPGIAIAQWHMGSKDAAITTLRGYESKFGDGSAYFSACVLAQFGEIDRALDRLELGRKKLDTNLTVTKRDPLLDPLRAEARFSALLNQIGFD
jgi:TolB-like protein/Tfp pilus assembly protein PilF